METPKNFATEVNKTVYDFIWKQKPTKIKKQPTSRRKSDGGLGMKDFVLFDKTLKLTWVKQLCSNSEALWKYIPKSSLSAVGRTELFQCSYDYLTNHFWFSMVCTLTCIDNNTHHHSGQNVVDSDAQPKCFYLF